MIAKTKLKKIRKVSLGKIEQKQSQNSVRSIINSASKNMFRNVHQIHQNSMVQLNPIKTVAIKQKFDSKLEQIQQKLKKIQQNQTNSRKSIGQIQIEAMNFSKKRNQQINIPLQSCQNWKVWTGNVFIQVCDRAFQLFLNNQLTYEQMKAFCSQKILLNLITLSKNTKCCQNNQFQEQMYEQLKKIIDYLCNKYPQTQKSQINKKLKEITQKNLINNSENDDYDLIDQSQIQFKYNSDEDYSKEVMQFMNYLITLTSFPTQNGKTLNYNFQIFMQNIFSIVQSKDKNNDMNLLLNQVINDHQKYQVKFQKEEDIEYQQKVKSYTHYAIGSKIPPNTPLYTEEEIISGHINIKNKTVARTLDKWTEELYDKMENQQKTIMQRTYRFKGIIPKTRYKPNPQMKQILFNYIKQQFQNIAEFKSQLCDNVLEITKGIMKDLPGLSKLSYISENQRSMAELACKMEQASVEYSIQTLNKLIHCFLRGVQNFRKQWLKKSNFPQQNFANQNINVNLVTCKIGDLLRCKFSSKEDEVVRILQFLLTMSQMNYLGLFKIIRIKNRLSQGTRDILINAYFKNKIVCQIQLAVNQSSNQKQAYMDKFNHFLYQLKRAELGTMMQLCGVWVNYDPKSKIFVKAIEEQNKIKEKDRKNKCQITFKLENNYKVVRFPFICKICKIFQPGQKTIFQNVKFQTHQSTICGQCIGSRMQNNQRKYHLFKQNQTKSSKHKKILDKIEQIFTYQQIDKHQIYFMVPKNARKINKYFVRKVQTSDRVFFAQNSFVNGKLQIQTKFSLNKEELKMYQKKIFDKYCVFIFNVPYQIKKIDFSKRNFFQLIKKDIEYLKNPNCDVGCLQIEHENTIMLFPFYKNRTCEINYLKKAQNKKFIIRRVEESKQVLQVSKRKIFDEFSELPTGVLIKMNSTLKQIYLDDNNLQQLSFIKHMQILEILTAKNNKLKQIPQIPACLVQLELANNKISKINKLDQQLSYKLTSLILYDNQIENIQNLESFIKLSVLVLSFNLITKIQNINMLENIQKLILFSNPIEKIQNIQNLTRLTHLAIAFSKIQKLQNLIKNSNLVFLNLNNSKIKKIKDVCHLKNLNKLLLQNNEIQVIQNIEQCEELMELNLNKNKIQTMKNIQSLLNIKDLYLSSNLIKQIGFLQNLYQLRQLGLANNKISKIQGLEQNFMLQKLDLSGNLIQAIANIGHLSFLKKLQLSKNCIKTVQNVQDLANLQELLIQSNQVNKIMGFPSSIKIINLQTNKISELNWISQLSSKRQLEQVKLQNNPLSSQQINLIKNIFTFIMPKIKL